MAVSRMTSVVVPPQPLGWTDTHPEEAGKNKGEGEGEGEREGRRDGKLDIWDSIQTLNKDDTTNTNTPYVHPLVRRSKNSMSQRSLEVCTESLGSETGSDGFSDLDGYFSSSSSDDHDQEDAEKYEDQVEEGEGGGGYECYKGGRSGRRELESVNYHCSIGRRSHPRSFPPPLPSISRSDGPCVQMRRHRQDGRLVLEAVPVPSQNYLHWQREGGRLVLSFIETTFEEIYPCDVPTTHVEQEDARQQAEEEEEHVDDEEEEVVVEDVMEHKDEEEEEAEEGEEVEVVDRGIVVEVKLSSRQLKGHRPSLVINKFVGSAPLCNQADNRTLNISKENRYNGNGTAEATESTTSAPEVDDWGRRRRRQQRGGGQSSHNQPHHENKLLFTFKKLMSRQSFLHQVRRCSYQHGPLFIWEPCCVASS